MNQEEEIKYKIYANDVFNEAIKVIDQELSVVNNLRAGMPASGGINAKVLMSALDAQREVLYDINKKLIKKFANLVWPKSKTDCPDYTKKENQIGCGYCAEEKKCLIRDPKINKAKLGCEDWVHNQDVKEGNDE